MKLKPFLILSSLLFSGSTQQIFGEEQRLPAVPQVWETQVVTGIPADAESFSVEAMIDPVEAEGGDLQVMSGLAIGLASEETAIADRENTALCVDLREGGGRGYFHLWHRGKNLTSFIPDPKPPGWVDNKEFQHPNVRPIQEGTGYRIRLVVWPEGRGSRVRLFVDSIDRPREDHAFEERITAGVIKLFAMRGGAAGEPARTTVVTNLQLKPITPEQADTLPPDWETVLRALDFSYPPMAPIANMIRQGKMKEARSLFLRHMRTRNAPRGPEWKQVEGSVLHPDYRTIADELLEGRYGTVGYFANFADSWTDTDGDTHRWVVQDEPLQINWERDNGHLNRHFHWVSLAKTYDETGDERYAERFSDEVYDWVSREPFFWDRTPTIGGLNIMDGTTFRYGYMNTSNIGRRLELTWWPAYEVFRKSPSFSEDAHFAMLNGMIRQADLIMNPTSFAVHDDGAAHATMALLQTALMLPEFAASHEWKRVALERWDEMLTRQFHPDGSHVSLSTGYNWATILTLENFLRFYEQLGSKAPDRYFEILEKALEHPIALSTPSQTQIPLNDGGWGMVDDHYRRSLHWFPHREDFKWIATKGAEGTPPKRTSLYLPNAGQYVMRTGWGEKEHYLFFGAGPWGASHGKQDALNIYAQFGNHLLIRDAGRGSYSGVGNTVHAGRSLSFNTLSPDWAQENSIPHWKTEMHIGFHPPKRRWESNERFDYGEGAFTYGWHRPGEHIRGKWVRQVIFVKGQDVRRDGYYLVIDTVEPADSTRRTWRHPWQLNPDAIEVRPEARSVATSTAGAALQILPIDPEGTMQARIIEAQEEPELLGWRIYDTTAKPWPVPTYEWEAEGTFSRAWLIQMQPDEERWPVASVEVDPASANGELRATIHRKDGGTDELIRRFPGTPATTLGTGTVEGDLAIISRNSKGEETARLELSNGEDSVAARTPSP